MKPHLRSALAQRLQRAWAGRGMLACALWPLSLTYAALAGLRRSLYRLGVFQVQTLPVPVIVVGNLIAGGAGKTPTVLAVVALLRRHGWRPGIVSRGYGRTGESPIDVEVDTPASASGDEPLLLRRLSGVPVMVGRDRPAAARALLARHGAVDVIVSDDGLQHLALGRSAQVLVFDERGVANGWLLPAGPMREPLPRTPPPRTLVLYNAATASTPLPGSMARRELAGAASLADWWQGRAATPAALDALKGRQVIAAAGLARPTRFFDMLRDRGLRITALPLPDHFDFRELPWPATSADVVVTEKDAVKLDPGRIGSVRVWVVALDFQTDAAFEAALLNLLK